MTMTNQVNMNMNSGNQMSMSHANQMSLNNAGPIVKKNLMLTAAAAPGNNEKTETPMTPMSDMQENLPIPSTMPVVTSANSVPEPMATDDSPKTEENANKVQNEIEKGLEIIKTEAKQEPQLS